MPIRIGGGIMHLGIDGRTVATATERVGGWWEVTSWPRFFDRNQAITALTVTEFLETGRDSNDPLVAAVRRELLASKDRDTEAVWHRQRSRRLDGPAQRVAWRKLAMLDAAEVLADLRVPPGNRLEMLAGNRAGQYGIRINRQWRICFCWPDAGPENVEIVDYH